MWRVVGAENCEDLVPSLWICRFVEDAWLGHLRGRVFCVEAGFVAAELGVDVFEGEWGEAAFADVFVECGAVEFACEAAEAFGGAAARGDAVGDEFCGVVC